MIFLADILISIFLIALGYMAVCYYFCGLKWNSKNIEVLKISKYKAVYLVAQCCVVAIMMLVFYKIYHLELLPQIKLLALVLILFPIAAVDYRIQKIPNQFLLAALVIRALIYIPEIILSPRRALVLLGSDLLGAVIIGGFFLLLLVIFKNSIGMGDVKLFFVMGMFQGLWGVINSVFFSLFVSFVISIVLLISRKKNKDDAISFGPSILFGTIIGICLAGM